MEAVEARRRAKGMTGLSHLILPKPPEVKVISFLFVRRQTPGAARVIT